MSSRPCRLSGSGRLLLVGALIAFASGCPAGALGADRLSAIPPSIADRCALWTKPLLGASCRRQQDKARRALAQITTGRQLCLDPMFGDDLANCRARAEVTDQDTLRTRVQFLDVDPVSTWSPHANQAIWFENRTLIDIYLQGKGF